MKLLGGLLFVSAILVTLLLVEPTDKKEETYLKDTSKVVNSTVKVKYNSRNESLKNGVNITSNKVICTEKEFIDKNSGDLIFTKTCFYKKYKTISKGYPDYKGRYSNEYSVLKKRENGSYLEIKNSDLFNEGRNELLSIINLKIEKDYRLYSNDPETKECFEGTSFTPFNFDQLGISFDDEKINFYVTFDLSGACLSVDGTNVSFDHDEIQKYLNE